MKVDVGTLLWVSVCHAGVISGQQMVMASAACCGCWWIMQVWSVVSRQ